MTEQDQAFRDEVYRLIGDALKGIAIGAAAVLVPCAIVYGWAFR